MTDGTDIAITEPTSRHRRPEEKKKIKQNRRDQGRRPVQEAHQGHRRTGGHRRQLRQEIQGADRRILDSRLPPRQGAASRSSSASIKKEVHDQVKGEVLLASLEQLAEEFDVAPLSPPDLDPTKLDIPDKGDFVYEFEVEVRPHFDLPEYKGLKLKQPDAHVSRTPTSMKNRTACSPTTGSSCPRMAPLSEGDYVIVDMVTTFGNDKVGEAKEITLRVEDNLTFKDGVATKFGEQMIGAKAGEKRTVDISMTDAVANDRLKGQTVQATLEIKDVKAMRLPELDELYLEKYQCKTVDQFRERIRVVLERRLEYSQRQSAREQVLGLVTASATWELPQDLLQRQARKTLARRVMEMRESGVGEEEIKARERMLQRDVLSSTAQALKEHFVLQKIAENEKLEIDQTDIDAEIDRIADMYGESPRRIRAQFEREDLLETLAAQLIERKALDLILETAEYEDVVLGKESGMATADAQAVPGEMKDPTAAPPGEKAAEESV